MFCENANGVAWVNRNLNRLDNKQQLATQFLKGQKKNVKREQSWKGFPWKIRALSTFGLDFSAMEQQ